MNDFMISKLCAVLANLHRERKTRAHVFHLTEVADRFAGSPVTRLELAKVFRDRMPQIRERLAEDGLTCRFFRHPVDRLLRVNVRRLGRDRAPDPHHTTNGETK